MDDLGVEKSTECKYNCKLLQGQSMKQVDHTKFIGVYIDENCVGNFISIMFQWQYQK